MVEKINQMMAEVEAFSSHNLAEIEEFRIKMLGKKGELNRLMEEFKTVPAEQKRELGQKINQLKNFAQERIAAFKAEAEASAADSASLIGDMTRPGTA